MCFMSICRGITPNKSTLCRETWHQALGSSTQFLFKQQSIQFWATDFHCPPLFISLTCQKSPKLEYSESSEGDKRLLDRICEESCFRNLQFPLEQVEKEDSPIDECDFTFLLQHNSSPSLPPTPKPRLDVGFYYHLQHKTPFHRPKKKHPTLFLNWALISKPRKRAQSPHS